MARTAGQSGARIEDSLGEILPRAFSINPNSGLTMSKS
jgi:hypothetical protein